MSYCDGTVRLIAKKFMLKAQGDFCPVCQGPMTPELYNGPLNATFDHVHPRLGGAADTNKIGNLLLMHECCNAAKGGRAPTGCEILLLFAVNRAMRLPEGLTARFDQPWDC